MTRPRFSSRVISRTVRIDDIESCAGMTMRDGAETVGLSYVQFRRIVHGWGLRHLFPNCGKGSWIARKGYACKTSGIDRTDPLTFKERVERLESEELLCRLRAAGAL